MFWTQRKDKQFKMRPHVKGFGRIINRKCVDKMILRPQGDKMGYVV